MLRSCRRLTVARPLTAFMISGDGSLHASVTDDGPVAIALPPEAAALDASGDIWLPGQNILHARAFKLGRHRGMADVAMSRAKSGHLCALSGIEQPEQDRR